jgi:transposase
MGVPPKQDWREARRYRAWDLKQQGWKQRDVAHVSESAVSQWFKCGREQGVVALKSHPGPGPEPKLTTEQRERLHAMLAEGALAKEIMTN